nr:AT-rich binding protein [Drosophila kikkawai]
MSALSRREAWMAVAQECKIPMETCQARWKTLRDRYVREINKSSPKGFALFENLNFLRGHIKLKRRRPSNPSDPPYLTYYIDEMTQDGTSSSMIMQYPLEEQQEQGYEQLQQPIHEQERVHQEEQRQVQEQQQVLEQEQQQVHEEEQEQEYLSDNAESSSVEFVPEDTPIANELAIDPQNPPLPANNPPPAMDGMTALSKLISMLEEALKEKSKPVVPQDPFYKYLESILSRVDEGTRADIQLRLLNFVHEEIKKSEIPCQYLQSFIIVS